MIHRFLSLAVLSVLAIGCQSKEARIAAQTLSLHLNSEPVTLDPSQVEDGLGIRVAANIMDGLMGYNSRGELVRRLAETLDVRPDLREYRFKLRADAKWSDGKPIEAAHIRLGIERALLPKSGAKLSGLLKWIEGADEFAQGKTKAVSGIEIEGREIRFKLVKPISFFDQVMALPIAYPLRQDVLDAHNGRWDPLRSPQVPTSGAYRVRAYLPDQEIVLEGARELPSGAPRTVRLRIVADESTASTLFEQNVLDVLIRIPAFDQKRLEAKGVVRTVPFHATYFLGFNLKTRPFDQVAFRRAVAGAVKKGELVRLLGTGEEAAASWVPKGYEGYFPFRPDSEGRDTAFSGARVETREEIRISFDSGTRNSIALEKVQADLRERLGWKVRLKNMDWKSLVHSVYRDPDMVYRFGWSSPMHDPAVFLAAFVTKDPFNFSGYSNPAYDRLVSEIVAMKPSSEREKKIIEAQKIVLVKDAVVVPLYHYVTTYAVGPKINRYDVSPFSGVTLFEEVELKD